MKYEKDTTRPNSLRYLLDKPEDLKVEDLPVPDGIGEDIVKAVLDNPIDEGIYSFDSLSERVANMPELPRIPTYYEELDELLDGGMEPGELLVLSGPTKNGKSLLAQNISYFQALHGFPVLWFSLEMGWKQLTKRFIEMKDGMVDFKGKHDVPIYYPIDSRSVTLKSLDKKIAECKVKFGTKMIFIDHLHYLLRLSGSINNTSFMIGDIVRKIKSMAMKHDVSICLIAHITKLDVTQMPDLNSIRDSSFVAQESDFVTIVWRERNKGKAQQDIMENEDLFTDRTILSLEASRRTGRGKKIALGLYKNVFYPYSRYKALKFVDETSEMELHAHDKDQELATLASGDEIISSDNYDL